MLEGDPYGDHQETKDELVDVGYIYNIGLCIYL